jgi:hypothetical protein
MFDPKGMRAPSDYPDYHPVDGYGKQEAAGYGCEPELEPYRTEKLKVANKRSRLSERN